MCADPISGQFFNNLLESKVINDIFTFSLREVCARGHNPVHSPDASVGRPLS